MTQENIEQKLENDISSSERSVQGISFDKVSLNLNLEQLLSKFFSDDLKAIYDSIDLFNIFAKFRNNDLKSLPPEFFAKLKELLDNKEDFIIDGSFSSIDLKKSIINLITSFLDAFHDSINPFSEVNIFESVINTLPILNISNIFRLVKKIDSTYLNSLATPELFNFILDLIQKASSRRNSDHLNNIFSFIAYFFSENCVPIEVAEPIIKSAIDFGFNSIDSKRNTGFFVLQNCKTDMYFDILVKNNVMDNVLKDFTILELSQRRSLLLMMVNISKSEVFNKYLIDKDIFYYLFAWLTGSNRDNEYFQVIFQGTIEIITNLININPEENIGPFLDSKLPENLPKFWNHANFSKCWYYCFQFLETINKFDILHPILKEIDVLTLFEVIISEAKPEFIKTFLVFCRNVIEKRKITKDSTNLCNQIDEFFQDEFTISQLEESASSKDEELSELSVYFLEKYQFIE